MSTRHNHGTIMEFSHRRKAEVQELLINDDRLREVEHALKEFLKCISTEQHSRESHLKSLYARCLYCFATVTYSRCFSSGRRKKLRIGDVAALTDRDRELHENVRRLRNQFFAHAVSDEEDARVLLHAKGLSEEPNGFVVMQVVLMGDGHETAQQFLSLVRKVRAHLASRISEAGDEMAKAFFGPDATWAKCAPRGKAGV